MNHYITTRRVLTIIAALLILIDIALGVLIWRQEHKEPEEFYPMANQHIEWTGAGYQRIGGADND